MSNERLPGNRASLGKFAIAFAPVLRSAEPRKNPLPDIARKMQDEIAGAVGSGIGTPPNFIFGKLLKAFDDVGEIVFRHQLLRIREKQACCVACFRFHVGHLAYDSESIPIRSAPSNHGNYPAESMEIKYESKGSKCYWQILSDQADEWLS